MRDSSAPIGWLATTPTASDQTRSRTVSGVKIGTYAGSASNAPSAGIASPKQFAVGPAHQHVATTWPRKGRLVGA